MKLFFYANTNCRHLSNGISQKVRNQIKAMRKLGFQVWYSSYTKQGIEIYNNKDEVEFKKESKIPARIFRYIRREYLISGVIDYINNSENKFDYFYLRFHYFDNRYRKMLKVMKKDGYVIVEAHGYPYRKWGNPVMNYVYIKDVLFEKSCAQNIDCVAAISNEDRIWNCKTIFIDNAADLEHIRMKTQRKENKDELVLISVATERPYHAFNRLIHGIKQYYDNGGEQNIKLYMVGTYKNKTRKMVADLKLQEHVFFVGEMYGTELDGFFDEADLAVGTFGKRADSEFGSSIKSKEYFARGIPFINGWREYAFDDDYPYVLRFELDDSYIDMNKVITFYDNLRKQPDVGMEMRKFAEQNFTWEKQYEKLFREIW